MKFLRYIGLYVGIIIGLVLLLTMVACIPNNKNTMIKSAHFYDAHDGIEYKKDGFKNTMIHYYADSIMLNIIYNIDNKKPLKSIMEAKYYEERYMDVNDGFVKTVLDNKKANHEYIRYWHGSILILKPLLILFSVDTIYLINRIILTILGLVVFIKLYKNSKKLSIAYLIGMIMTTFYIVPYCFEYSWVYYIMLINMLIVLKVKDLKRIYPLFFITGILTCFFDFLSTEIITLFVPLIVYLWINHKSFKKSFIIFIKCVILWTIGYMAMWFTKWILASLILNINAYDYVFDKAMLRINGLQGLPDKSIMYKGLFYRNFNYLYPICIMDDKNIILFIIALFLIFTDYKNIKNKKLNIILLFIALSPYVRYLVLANHSYRHAFFTFRMQIITIMSLILIIFNSLNYDFIIDEIRRVKKWK